MLKLDMSREETFANASALEDLIDYLLRIEKHANEQTDNTTNNKVILFKSPYLTPVEGVIPEYTSFEMPDNVYERGDFGDVIKQVLKDKNVYSNATFKRLVYTDITYPLDDDEEMSPEAYETISEIATVLSTEVYAEPIAMIFTNDKINEYPVLHILYITHNKETQLRKVLNDYYSKKS